MKINAKNNFYYLGKTYQNCFFYCRIDQYFDTNTSTIECFMYNDENKYNMNYPYIYSFGISISNDIIDNENLIFEQINDFFKSISPNVILELIN